MKIRHAGFLKRSAALALALLLFSALALPAFGAPSHLATLLLAKEGKVSFTYVPYKANPQAYIITKKQVTAKSVLKLHSAPGGGFAISIKPL